MHSAVWTVLHCILAVVKGSAKRQYSNNDTIVACVDAPRVKKCMMNYSDFPRNICNATCKALPFFSAAVAFSKCKVLNTSPCMNWERVHA